MCRRSMRAGMPVCVRVFCVMLRNGPASRLLFFDRSATGLQASAQDFFVRVRHFIGSHCTIFQHVSPIETEIAA
jgi:hypothetical protein